MSFNAMSWAAGLKLKCYEKLVLLMLANRASPANNSCFPSMSKLAKDCGMSAVQARRAVASLEKKGLLQRVAQIRSHGQTSNMFTLFVGNTPDLIDRPPNLIDRHKLLPLNSGLVTRFPAKRDNLDSLDIYLVIGNSQADAKAS